MALQAIKQFRCRELGAVLKATTNTTPTATTATSKLVSKTPKILNPFIPRKNPDTGRWAPAKYSLRRQAELVKKAKESQTLHLLPPGPKFGLAEWQKELKGAVVEEPVNSEHVSAVKDSEGHAKEVSEKKKGKKEIEWTQKVMWEGEVKEKKVAGAEIGNRLYAGKKRMFKGHKWERMKGDKEKQMKMLMRSMPQRIRRFKGVSVIAVYDPRLINSLVVFADIPSEETQSSESTTCYHQSSQTSVLVLHNLSNTRSFECSDLPPHRALPTEKLH